MNVRSMLSTSAIAGLVMGILSNMPVLYLANCLACIWLWGSGIFAAWLYQRLSKTHPAITVEQGAIVGALSGVVGAIVGTIASIVFGGVGVGLLFAQSGAPEDVAASVGFHLGLASITGIFFFIIYIIVYPVFGAIGGAAGGKIFTEDRM